MDRAAAAAADLRNDPRVTTTAEAGTINEHVRFILELVPQAAHGRSSARSTTRATTRGKRFEGSIRVPTDGSQLYAEEGRAYLKL
jgi:hypothetical protein